MMLLSVARERLMLSAFPLSSALALIGQTDCLHVTTSINVPPDVLTHVCTKIYVTKNLCSNILQFVKKSALILLKTWRYISRLLTYLLKISPMIIIILKR